MLVLNMKPGQAAEVDGVGFVRIVAVEIRGDGVRARVGFDIPREIAIKPHHAPIDHDLPAEAEARFGSQR